MLDVVPATPQPLPPTLAATLDREADRLLQAGYHLQAERLAHRAAEMRQGIAALKFTNS